MILASRGSTARVLAWPLITSWLAISNPNGPIETQPSLRAVEIVAHNVSPSIETRVVANKFILGPCLERDEERLKSVSRRKSNLCSGLLNLAALSLDAFTPVWRVTRPVELG